MSGRHNWLWLIPALLLVTALSAHSLNDLLWVDEVFSIGNTGGYQGTPYNPTQVWESLSRNSPQHVPGSVCRAGAGDRRVFHPLHA
jgi:hypothetical protein